MEVLYSDDRVFVCVKPAGVLSTDEPGGMPELIRRELGGDNAVVRGVHRLDRVVGGVMVYARTKRAASELSGQMRLGLFQKKYLAVVNGQPEPAAGVMLDLLRRDTLRRVTVVETEPGPGVQSSELSYETLAAAGGCALVRITLKTGRTHQIRCQFASRGMPLCGDAKYGAPSWQTPVALWSNSLSFQHPRTGERLTFSAPPPDIEPWTRFTIG